MLGTLRTFLALVVAAGHLWGSFLGVHAVYGFYIISGFLMTRIVNERYGYSPRGFGLYILNRFLRIYPVYWLACAVGIALVFVLGEDWTSSFQRNIKLPEQDVAWLALSVNWYWSPDNASHLVPPSWAIAVEFLFYLLIGLGLGRSKFVVLIWLSLAIGYHAFALSFGWDRYASPLAAMLPYALGAWIYHTKDTCHYWLSSNARHFLPWLIPLYVLLMLSNPIHQLWNAQMTWIFYLGIVMSALIVATLGNIQGQSTASRMDAVIGNLSYPIYLFHYAAGAVMAAMYGLPAKSMETFLATLPMLLVISWLVVRLNEVAIETWRGRISKRARSLLATAK